LPVRRELVLRLVLEILGTSNFEVVVGVMDGSIVFGFHGEASAI
jgi:hypothetical protein